MKYIIGVLCVAYLPAYCFAEQLQDHTNTATPHVPDAINRNNQFVQAKRITKTMAFTLRCAIHRLANSMQSRVYPVTAAA